MGTVLALIIDDAGASIPEMIILSSMFKKKLIIAFVLNVFLGAFIVGYLVDLRNEYYLFQSRRAQTGTPLAYRMTSN